ILSLCALVRVRLTIAVGERVRASGDKPAGLGVGLAVGAGNAGGVFDNAGAAAGAHECERACLVVAESTRIAVGQRVGSAGDAGRQRLQRAGFRISRRLVAAVDVRRRFRAVGNRAARVVPGGGFLIGVGVARAVREGVMGLSGAGAGERAGLGVG